MRRKPRVRLEPILSGGGQERGLRSGTLAPHLCIGMGAAAKLGRLEMKRDGEWVKHLSERLRKFVCQYFFLIVSGELRRIFQW